MDHSSQEKICPPMSHLNTPCSLLFGFLPASEYGIRDKHPPTWRGMGQNSGYLFVLEMLGGGRESSYPGHVMSR